MSGEKLRIGAVPYLNASPLIYGLDEREDVELVQRVPSELADLLAVGGIDVGIVPMVEYLRGVGNQVLPGVSISARGPVRSVLVFLGRPAAEVETLATDTSSRSSAALAQVVFRKRYGTNPIQVPCPPDLDAMLTRADAALLIGDQALAAEGTSHDRLDLGEAWHELTGQPFTFAAWVAGAGAPTQKLITILQEAKSRGVANIPVIAERESRDGRFPASFIESYLTNNLDHDLTDEHFQGIRRFATYTQELGIIPEPRRLRIAPRW